MNSSGMKGLSGIKGNFHVLFLEEGGRVIALLYSAKTLTSYGLECLLRPQGVQVTEGKFLQSLCPLWLKVTKIRSFQALPNCTMLLKIQSMMWHIIWQLWFALPYNPMAAFVRTDTFNVIRFPQFPKGALDGAGGFSDLFCQFCD